LSHIQKIWKIQPWALNWSEPYKKLMIKGCTYGSCRDVFEVIPNCLVPTSIVRLIMSLYLGSKICNGHLTVGKLIVHTKIGTSDDDKASWMLLCSLAVSARVD
jgi:hypothetical protein